MVTNSGRFILARSAIIIKARSAGIGKKGKVKKMKFVEKNYIIRESEPHYIDFDFSEYFAFDKITGEEDFNATVFFVGNRDYIGYNTEKWEEIVNKAENIMDGFLEIGGKYATYNSYKECMEDFEVEYNPHKCHLLRKWAEYARSERTEDIAEFLSIITGKKWEARTARGYSQSEWIKIVFCVEEYTEKEIKVYGDYYLGCFREFCVITLDEYGDEVETVWGYYVTDTEAWKDEDYKKVVCEREGISEDEARLEMIDGSYTSYTYRTA